MDKKDIYEHLAEIYLDASSKKRKKVKPHPRIFKNPFFISAVFLFVFIVLLLSLPKNKPFDADLALVLLPTAEKINFHFNPAKKEAYILNFNKLNLTRFKTLEFSVKKVNYQDNISLRVEFTNVFKEKSEVYFKDIPHRWQDYKVSLADFKGINDWSEMLNLSFTIEEWNVKEKRGVVYIDNVRLLK